MLLIFFHPLNIVEFSPKKMCVQEANFGKVAKSREIFCQNYFAHICPEYGLGLNVTVQNNLFIFL